MNEPSGGVPPEVLADPVQDVAAEGFSATNAVR
jgi:hypothetical protein